MSSAPNRSGSWLLPGLVAGLLLVSILGAAWWLGMGTSTQVRAEISDQAAPAVSKPDAGPRKVRRGPAGPSTRERESLASPPLRLIVESPPKPSGTQRQRPHRIGHLTWIQGRIRPVEGQTIRGRLLLWQKMGGHWGVVDQCGLESGQRFKLLGWSGETFQIRAEIAGRELPQLCSFGLSASGRSMDLGVLDLDMGREVQCRVLTSTGGPLPKALVQLHVYRWYGGRHPPFRLRAGTTAKETDRKGRVVWEHVPPDAYWVVVRAEGYPPSRHRFFLYPGVRGRDRVVIRLKTGADLYGLVQDSRGRPVPGARIQSGESGEDPAKSTAVSDARGRFHLLRGSSDQVMIQKEGYLTGRFPCFASPRNPRLFRLTRRPEQPLRGQVFWPGDRPATPASILLEPMSYPGEPLETTTDSSGHFEFPDLHEGRYAVSAIHEKFGRVQKRVDYPRETQVWIGFPERAEITFRVGTDMGRPAGDASLSITQVQTWKRQGRLRSETQVWQLDAQGRYVFSAVVGSILLWKVQDPKSHQFQEGALQVKGSQDKRIQFSSYARVLGKLDLRLLPVEELRGQILLELWDEKIHQRQIQVCKGIESGRYSFDFEAVLQGAYLFRVYVLDEARGKRRLLASSAQPTLLRPGRTQRFDCRVTFQED